MADFSGKYMKVRAVKEQGGYKKLDLKDSKKNKDGSYDNWVWFGCLLVGDAKDKEINEGDVVEVKSGNISKRKYNEKYYENIVIFHIEVTKKADPEPEPDVSQFETVTDEDVPF